ncbi:unnamed protein product [Sphagnum tenellum]
MAGQGSTVGLKCVFLMVLVIAALVVQAEADATVINADITDGSPVVFYVNGKRYSVGITSVDVKVDTKDHKEDVVVQGSNGKDTTVSVSDGDIVVVVPSLSGNGSGIVVSINGNQFP